MSRLTVEEKKSLLMPGKNIFLQRDVYNAIFSLILVVLVTWLTTCIPWYFSPFDTLLAVIAWLLASVFGLLISYLFKLYLDIYLPTLLTLGLTFLIALVFLITPPIIIIAGKNPGFIYFSLIPVMVFSAIFLSLFLFNEREIDSLDQRTRILFYHAIPTIGLVIAGLMVNNGPIEPILYTIGLIILVIILGLMYWKSSLAEKQAVKDLRSLIKNQGTIFLEDLPAKEADIRNHINKSILNSSVVGKRVIYNTASTEIKKEVLIEEFERQLDPRESITEEKLSIIIDKVIDQTFVLLKPKDVVLLLENSTLPSHVYETLVDSLAKRNRVKESWLERLRVKSKEPEIELPKVNQNGYMVEDSELSTNEQRLVEIMDKMEREAKRWNASEENNRLTRELNRISEGLDNQKWFSNNACKTCHQDLQVIGIHEFTAPGFKLEFTFCQDCQKGAVRWITPSNVTNFDHQVETIASFFNGLHILRHPSHHLLFVDPNCRLFAMYDINRDELFPFPQNMERTRILSKRDLALLKKHWGEIERIVNQEKQEKNANSPVKPRHFQDIGQSYLALAKEYIETIRLYEAYEFAYRSNYFLAKALLYRLGTPNGKSLDKKWIDNYASILTENGMVINNENNSPSENIDKIHDVLMNYEEFAMMKQLPNNEAVKFMVSIAELASAIIESNVFKRDSF